MSNQVSQKSLFPDSAGRVFGAVKSGSIVDKARESFRDKTHLERFRPHYESANIGGYLFQFAAALCAFTFFHRLFSGLVPDVGRVSVWAAWALAAFVVVVALEVAKRLFFGDFIKSAMSGRVSVAPLLGNAALLVMAVVTATACAVSESTVHNVKRVLRNLNSAATATA